MGLFSGGLGNRFSTLNGHTAGRGEAAESNPGPAPPFGKRTCLLLFQTPWGLKSPSVFGDPELNGIDTCRIALEHSVTRLVKKVGAKGAGREVAVLDPCRSQLKLIGKSF